MIRNRVTFRNPTDGFVLRLKKQENSQCTYCAQVWMSKGITYWSGDNADGPGGIVAISLSFLPMLMFMLDRFLNVNAQLNRFLMFEIYLDKYRDYELLGFVVIQSPTYSEIDTSVRKCINGTETSAFPINPSIGDGQDFYLVNTKVTSDVEIAVEPDHKHKVNHKPATPLITKMTDHMNMREEFILAGDSESEDEVTYVGTSAYADEIQEEGNPRVKGRSRPEIGIPREVHE